MRPSDWQFGASVQQQLLPRVSVEVGYFKRWLQNFTATDNLVGHAGDFTPFSITAPSDPRLPDGGGYAVDGLYNVVPGEVRPDQQQHHARRQLRQQYQSYNGMLLNVSARIRNGLTLQGGINSGKTVNDNCAFERAAGAVARHRRSDPEPDESVLPQSIRDSSPRSNGVGVLHDPEDRRARRGNVPQRSGRAAARHLERAGRDGLGRRSAGRPPSPAPRSRSTWSRPARCGAIASTRSTCGSAKILRFGRMRTNVGIDIFNLINSNAVLTYNQTFNPRRRRRVAGAASVLTPRFLKISAQIDF